MYLMIYAIVLLGFWVRAMRMKPERYPKLDPDAVLKMKYHLMDCYRRYAAYFIFAFILAIVNGMLWGYLQKNPSTWLHTTATIFTVIIAIYNILVLVYIIRNAIKNYRDLKLMGMISFI